jgi:hypothetical protein
LLERSLIQYLLPAGPSSAQLPEHLFPTTVRCRDTPRAYEWHPVNEIRAGLAFGFPLSFLESHATHRLAR